MLHDLRRVSELGLWFAKVEALGNDLVWLLDPAEVLTVQSYSRHAPALCDRHTGIGADGLVLWDGCESDPELWFINADGSPAEVCGNGLRAIAVAGRDIGLFSQDEFAFRSGGIVFPVVVGGSGKPAAACLGLPGFPCDGAVEETLRGWGITGMLVTMPNPHIVILDGPLDRGTRESLAVRSAGLLPGGANVGFCAVQAGELDLEVWERGVGWTRACGSGAAAAAAAALRRGALARGVTVVRQPGGTLRTWLDEQDRSWIEGDASLVFVGFMRACSPAHLGCAPEALHEDAGRNRGSSSVC
ncbi:MAG: diaminopimelate epimerase [Candidatus Eisenbacteria bacterium]|nr:diaminopimelate epimerase [Candidatus Eisenbacteria bacterium]